MSRGGAGIRSRAPVPRPGRVFVTMVATDERGFRFHYRGLDTSVHRFQTAMAELLPGGGGAPREEAGVAPHADPHVPPRADRADDGLEELLRLMAEPR